MYYDLFRNHHLRVPFANLFDMEFQKDDFIVARPTFIGSQENLRWVNGEKVYRGYWWLECGVHCFPIVYITDCDVVPESEKDFWYLVGFKTQTQMPVWSADELHLWNAYRDGRLDRG